MASEKLIEETARRLAAAATEPVKVILFGSHARGDAAEESDLDFLVIEPHVSDWIAESTRLRRRFEGCRPHSTSWWSALTTPGNGAMSTARSLGARRADLLSMAEAAARWAGKWIDDRPDA